MLKAFLVEDELIVREGIKTTIDWQGCGFIFCGEAADGELAYPLIERERPDVLITDIKMPFMDGLELSRLVKKALPECKIIILSGHEEFRFAQEALKIGVTEYLLKPINSAEVTELLHRMRRLILKEQEERRNLERYLQEAMESEEELRLRLFQDIVSGTLPLSEILERGRALKLELHAQWFEVALITCGSTSQAGGAGGAQAILGREIRRMDMGNGTVFCFDRGIEGVALLFKGDTQQELEQLRQGFLEKLEAGLKRHESLWYFGGVGSPVNRLTRLMDSYESAAHALSLRFMRSRNQILHYTQIGAQRLMEDNGSPLDAIENGGLDIRRVEAFLRGGNQGEVAYFTEELLREIGHTNTQSLLFRQYVLMDIYFTALKYLKEIGGLQAEAGEPFQRPGQAGEILDAAQYKAYLHHVLSGALSRRDELHMGQYRAMLDKARAYIAKHYADENISLSEVANHVNVSPNYFSTIFSRETGESFIKYLTDVRMEKAKELLCCSDLRCAEIGFAVGYKDPHYFSYLFKKTQNCSPIQYRNTWGAKAGSFIQKEAL